MKDVKNMLHSLGVLDHTNADIDSFFEKCKKRNITPFLGAVTEVERDVDLYDLEQLFEYCHINGIKSIFIDYDYEERIQTTINVELCKKALTDYFIAQKSFECRFHSFHFIEDDYFDTVKTRIFSEFEKEISDIRERETRREDNKTGQLKILTAYVIHNGFLIFAPIYQNEAIDDLEEHITERSLIKKYKTQIDYNLRIRIQQAREEENAIWKKTKEEVMKKITSSIRDNIELLTMNTQKKRNEYVDRIVSEWKYDRGNDWLLKKDITAIVESEYSHAIDRHNKEQKKL